jgi:NAD(P)-dependent dehydrogenase (short-subunit alcohol dehydrogenase family)
VAPGFVYTPIYKNIIRLREKFPQLYGDCKTDEDVLNVMVRNIPLQRIQTVGDIANAVMFLSSDGAANITGDCLLIEGGQTIL